MSVVAEISAASNKPLPVADDRDVQQLVGANTDFAFSLLREMAAAKPDANVFFSPLSVSVALTMTLAGAGGQTRRDMTDTLGLRGISPEQISHAVSLLLPALTQPATGVEVRLANALWAGQSITLARTFCDDSLRFYDAHTQTLDFDAPGAADVINGWVYENTGGNIANLVAPQDLSGGDVVLTNALHFHGKWQTPFRRTATLDAPFTCEDGTKRSVPLMYRQGQLLYSETAEAQSVSIPYGDGRMSFHVILPRDGQTLTGLINGLNRYSWEGDASAMSYADVELYLPRFQAHSGAHLKETLSALGMGSAFQSGANFGPMGLSDLFLADVIHEALIQVNEEGTVASAATLVKGDRGMPPPPRTIMRVDHPFFCAIRDNDTGTLLFAGVIRDPKT